MRVKGQSKLFEEYEELKLSSSDTSSTFIANLSLPVHRWFRYSAGFSASWVRNIIEQGKRDGRTRVLDPFAGSGTVLLEAERCGVSTIIEGGSVNSISVNPTDSTLIIYLSSFGDGTLIIDQPRTLIDAEEGGTDVEFVVFANGYFVNSEEQAKDDNKRTLKIYFPKGTEIIEIVGTSVVPEFNATVYLILGAAVMSIIVIRLRAPARALSFRI